jgi:hypothetical protein
MLNDSNLDTKIAAWKNEMLGRLRDPDAVEELETHLRELLETAVTAGASTDDAWRTAVRKLGDANGLQREFAKLSRAAWLDTLTAVVVGMIMLGLVMPLIQHIFVASPAMQADRLLGIHVFTITLGYIGTVGAGLIGAYAVLRLALGGATNRVLDRWMPRAVVVACGVEAGLMLAGIVLGAIWASDHLGRAWGWDAKEIGAACTLLFHVGLLVLAVKRKISNDLLLALASVGATLTLFAWFGPAALGVGLRAYGFPAFTLVPLAVAAIASGGITMLAVRRDREMAGR